MTEAKHLNSVKFLAKRYARASRITLHQALDTIAGKLDFANWTKLVSASKKGWMPNGEQLASLEAFVANALPAATSQPGAAAAMPHQFASSQEDEIGMIEDHPFRLRVILHDVVMVGDGWTIRVPENPAGTPIVQTSPENAGQCAVSDPAFLKKALDLARHRAVQIRGEISTDWPRRSTKPDRDGLVRHPLWGSESDVWFCLHCDGKITGVQIAQNLWHCPGCGASPLDIYDKAFWCEDGGITLMPVVAGADKVEADFRVTDDTPRLELTEDKIILLMRSALLDDAMNVSEKLGALHAEINVDDDNDVWISLEEDLWPHDKEPVQVLKVAAQLGIEVELETMWSGIPFAWPSLGEQTVSTSEYVQLMLNAYAQHAPTPKQTK